VPAGQAWQVDEAVAPVAAEYVPAGHWMQSISASLPVVGKYVPAGQAWQVDEAVAPGVVE
jgi:hypothetical protein